MPYVPPPRPWDVDEMTTTTPDEEARPKGLPSQTADMDPKKKAETAKAFKQAGDAIRDRSSLLDRHAANTAAPPKVRRAA